MRLRVALIFFVAFLCLCVMSRKHKLMLRLIALLFLLSYCACTPKKKTATPKPLVELESLEQEAFQLFQEQAGDAIPLFQQLAERYSAKENHLKAGITYLNIANIYDEHLTELDSAVLYANRSLDIWKDLNDSLQQANIYKYRGRLQGRLGNFLVAKSDIDMAMQLYKLLEYEEGLTVSKFNLADVLFQEGELAKSATLYEETIAFWRKKGNSQRVFTNNLFGIRLYRKMEEQTKVAQLITENQQIQKTTNIAPIVQQWFDELLVAPEIQ